MGIDQGGDCDPELIEAVVQDKVFVDRELKLRQLSKEIFGQPNCPIKVVYKDLRALFGRDFDSLTFDELKDFARQRPEIQKLTRTTLIDPPAAPALSNLTVQSAGRFLSDSRHLRLLFPMLDKLTKRSSIPCSDSTRLKFDLGVDIAGCYHVGSGSVVASSVPEAAKRIDIVTGDNAFEVTAEDIGGRILVSDLAMPTQDGMGCSRNPILIKWLVGLARSGVHIIAKVTVDDLDTIDYPFKYLCKPRPHNFEVIISLNIPGVDLSSFDDLLGGIVANNIWRNKQCVQGAIDEVAPYVEEDFDESLLFDPRDWSGYGVLSSLPFPHKSRRRNRINVLDTFDAAKCRTMVDSGFLSLTDNVNMYTMKVLDRYAGIDEQIEFMSAYYTEAEAASIITLRKFVGMGAIQLTRHGKVWTPASDKRF